MVRVNDEIAAVLQEYADLLAITGGDAFRVRSYEKAARSVGGYPEDVSRLDVTGLRQIPNVGASIAAKIDEQLRTGRSISWRNCAPRSRLGCGGSPRFPRSARKRP